MFAQKDETLSRWVLSRLLRLNYRAGISWGEARGTWGVTMAVQSHVKRLGEWLGSCKYQKLLDEGYACRVEHIDRRTGQPIQARPSQFPLRRYSVAEQEQWRGWRRLGASYADIGRHVGASNSVIASATCDVVPEDNQDARDLGLRPRASFGRQRPEAVEAWRAAARGGARATEIKRDLGLSCSVDVVRNAISDIVWDLETAKVEAMMAYEHPAAA